MFSKIDVQACCKGSFAAFVYQLKMIQCFILQFGLDKLKDEAKAAIRAGLSEQNIVEELCSDFAWR